RPRAPGDRGVRICARVVSAGLAVSAVALAVGCVAATQPPSAGRAILADGPWKGGGQRASQRTPRGKEAWGVTVPANGMKFLSRDTPNAIAFSDSASSIAIDVWTDAPQNLARVSIMARSGGPNEKDDTIASTSGFVQGWNHLVFPRSRFFAHWFSKFTWGHAQEVAVRIETNANGPAEVRVGDLSVEAAAPASTAPAGTAAAKGAPPPDRQPPVVERLTLSGGGRAGV